MSYLLADKCIFKWRIEAQPHYIFTTKPAPQANLDTSEDLPKKKVLTATEPVYRPFQRNQCFMQFRCV